MADGYVLGKVLRLGYTFDHDPETDSWWFRTSEKFEGPYKSLDAAAYAAITESEISDLMGGLHETQ